MRHTHTAYGKSVQVDGVVMTEFWQDAKTVTARVSAMAMSLSQPRSRNSVQLVRIEIKHEVAVELRTVLQQLSQSVRRAYLLHTRILQKHEPCNTTRVR